MEHSEVFNTEHIGQVLKILSKTIKRKFPFIKKLELNKVGELFVIINVVVDYNEFLESNNLILRSDIEDILMEYPENADKYINYQKYSYLHIILQSDDEVTEEFGWRYNKEIEDVIEEIVNYLPEQIVPKVEWYGAFSDDIENTSFKISDFVLKFDFDRYMNYVKGK
jgi:hypothetical protein